MNPLLRWLTSPEWTHVVGALLHSLWQGAIIAIALAVLMRRLTNPVTRYRCALGMLGVLVVASIITWAVLNTPTTPIASPFPTAESAFASTPTTARNLNPTDKVVVVGKMSPPAAPMNWTAGLALVWILGAAVMLLRASVKVAGAENLRRSCKPLDDEHVIMLVAEACRAVNLARKIRVAVTDKLTSPAVVGVIVPTLILPLSLFSTLTPEQIRFILLHELAHIRRGDYLANLFQLFAEALLFFNPAVWWISHQIRREREACCDALAIELSGAPADYAKALVRVAENILQPTTSAALAFGDDGREPSPLADRVQRLLVPGYRPALRLTWRAMLTSLFVGGVLLVLSAVGTRNTVGAILTSNQPSATTNTLLPTPSPTNVTGQTPSTMMDQTNRTRFKNGPVLAYEGFGYASPWGPTGNHRDFRTDTAFDLNSVASNTFRTRAGTGKSSSIGAQNQEPWFWYRVGDEREGQVPTNATPANQSLANRTFNVGPMELTRALGRTGPVVVTNTTELVAECLAKAGVDLQPPKAVFFKDPLGLLLVRALPAELDAIEKFLAQGNRGPAPTNSSTNSFSVENNPEISDANSNTNLYTRTFRVDANALVQALERRLGTKVFSGPKPDETKLLPALRQFFATVGVDLDVPKAVYFNGTKGELFVRATLADLDAIEALLEVLNYSSPQVNLKVRWVEVASAAGGTLSPGVLSEAQAGEVLQRLNHNDGFTLLSEGQITTLSTRQAQFQVAEVRTIVTGINPAALTAPGIVSTNATAASALVAQTMSFGPVLDVIPCVGSDQNQIALHVEAATKEFLGYGKKSPQIPVYINGKKRKTTLPLPRYLVRQTTNDSVLRDGETLVLGHLPAKEIAPQFNGEIKETEVTDPKANSLYVLVTAMLIDPASNRLNPPKQTSPSSR